MSALEKKIQKRIKHNSPSMIFDEEQKKIDVKIYFFIL